MSDDKPPARPWITVDGVHFAAEDVEVTVEGRVQSWPGRPVRSTRPPGTLRAAGSMSMTLRPTDRGQFERFFESITGRRVERAISRAILGRDPPAKQLDAEGSWDFRPWPEGATGPDLDRLGELAGLRRITVAGAQPPSKPKPPYEPRDRKRARAVDGRVYVAWTPLQGWGAEAWVHVDGARLVVELLKPTRTGSPTSRRRKRHYRVTVQDLPLWELPLTPAVFRARRDRLEALPPARLP
jgi:hypothetical protein